MSRRALVHRISASAPDDMSGIEAAIAGGRIDPKGVIAVLAKTEGNGLRTNAIAQRLRQEATERIHSVGNAIDAIRQRHDRRHIRICRAIDQLRRIARQFEPIAARQLQRNAKRAACDLHQRTASLGIQIRQSRRQFLRAGRDTSCHTRRR